MNKVSPTVKVLVYIILSIMAVSLVFPIIFMVTNSFMGQQELPDLYATKAVANEEVTYATFKLIPSQITLSQYYQVLLRKPKFLIMFWNSVFMTVSITLGQIVVSSLAAYAFAKLRFPGRDALFFVFIVVMLLPYQVVLVPNYIVMSKLKLINTYYAIILPGIFATFGVFLLRQFMRSIPDEYCEAAKIDGAGYLRVFGEIILPQVKAGIASLAILCFIDNWNMVEQPLIMLDDRSMYPLSVYLRDINHADLGIAFACGIIYMLPALLIFLYGEDYLIKGIQLSGIK